MSDSDSELDFESADEGQQHEDLSDLDVDEILNEENETKTDEKEEREEIVEEKTATADTKALKQSISEEEDEKATKNDTETEIKKIEEVESAVDKLKIVQDKLEETQKTDSIGWDDAKWDDLEDDNSNIKESDNNRPQLTQREPVKEELVAKEPKPFKNDDKNVQDVLTCFSKPEPCAKDQPKQSQASNSNQSGWSSWSSFGTSLLSSAINLTSQVLETVESSLGAPDPSELAAEIAKSQSEQKLDASNDTNKNKLDETKDKIKSDWDNSENDEWFSLNSLPLNKLATTFKPKKKGLEVLETVGKKTFDILSEKDPNLKQTREFLKKVPSTIVTQKPNLSQLLREAQSHYLTNATSNYTNQSQTQSKSFANSQENLARSSDRLANFTLYFEEFKGVAHLEALEMLSRQNSVKLELQLLNKTLIKHSDIKSKLDLIDQLFDSNKLNDDYELDEDEHFSELYEDFSLLANQKEKQFDMRHFENLINEYATRFYMRNIIDKVVRAFKTGLSAANQEDFTSQEIYNESVKCFALITSSLIELYHKIAESILVEQQENNVRTSFKANSDELIERVFALFKLTKLFIRSVTLLSDDFCKKCKLVFKLFVFCKKIVSRSEANNKTSNQTIADIYLEASNTSTYIGDAYTLFVPILKSNLLLIVENLTNSNKD